MSFPLAHRPRSYSMTHINHAQALNADSECAQPCMHHPIAPQYPNGNAVKHLADLSEFVNIVAEGLGKIAFPRPQQRYSSVHVLMISWEDDDLGTAREIATLKGIFEEDYRYSTRHYEIPSYKNLRPGREPSWELEGVLLQTRNEHGWDEDGLLIIYYGGHGEVSKRSQHSIWKAWKSQPIGDRVPPKSPEIDWSESQAMIMGAKAEILFVLDCCYASASVRDFGQRYRGRRELLLASGNDKASNENTLTKALINELLDLGASPCTVSSLHAKLLQNQSNHNLKPAPIYTCMVGAKAGIVLAPLPDPNAPASSTPQGLVIPHADQKTLLLPCRVLISVSLTEIGGQSIRETWMEWFRDHAPPNVGAVNFYPLEVTQLMEPVATFDSNSSYLIFSLPVSIWNVMTPNPGISLLSIVRSGNHLHRRESTLYSITRGHQERRNEIDVLYDRLSLANPWNPPRLDPYQHPARSRTSYPEMPKSTTDTTSTETGSSKPQTQDVPARARQLWNPSAMLLAARRMNPESKGASSARASKPDEAAGSYEGRRSFIPKPSGGGEEQAGREDTASGLDEGRGRGEQPGSESEFGFDMSVDEWLSSFGSESGRPDL